MWGKVRNEGDGKVLGKNDCAGMCMCTSNLLK